ncbi:MAG: hypothetical protein ACRCYX_13545 [Dermatophilaceae bacterium]
MNIDLDQQLRELGASHRLDRTAGEVMDRGDQLRRRRGKRLSLAATAVALAGVAATAGLNANNNQELPLADPAPSQGGTLKLVNLSQPALDAVTAKCVSEESPIARADAPVAAIDAGELTTVVYRSGAEMYLCEVIEGADVTVQTLQWSFETYGERVFLTRFKFAPAEVEGGAADSGGTYLTGFGFADPDVVSVEAHIGGQIVPAALEDRMVALGSTEPFTDDEFDKATLVATTDEGEKIVTALF